MAGQPHREAFFPHSDAAILCANVDPSSVAPALRGPPHDVENEDTAALSWSINALNLNYPTGTESYAPACIPTKDLSSSDRYLRATLAHNERLRLSMLWYYTRDITLDQEFLSGLQEKVYIAQETTEWELAIIGILDNNVYTRLATVGVPLAILPRGEATCAHTILQPPGVGQDCAVLLVTKLSLTVSRAYFYCQICKQIGDSNTPHMSSSRVYVHTQAHHYVFESSLERLYALGLSV